MNKQFVLSIDSIQDINNYVKDFNDPEITNISIKGSILKKIKQIL